MKHVLLLIGISALLAGCGAGAGDVGAAPPPAQPLTEAKLAQMPPEASAGARAAQEQGAAMARQYNARYGK